MQGLGVTSPGVMPARSWGPTSSLSSVVPQPPSDGRVRRAPPPSAGRTMPAVPGLAPPLGVFPCPPGLAQGLGAKGSEKSHEPLEATDQRTAPRPGTARVPGGPTRPHHVAGVCPMSRSYFPAGRTSPPGALPVKIVCPSRPVPPCAPNTAGRGFRSFTLRGSPACLSWVFWFLGPVV